MLLLSSGRQRSERRSRRRCPAPAVRLSACGVVAARAWRALLRCRGCRSPARARRTAPRRAAPRAASQCPDGLLAGVQTGVNGRGVAALARRARLRLWPVAARLAAGRAGLCRVRWTARPLPRQRGPSRRSACSARRPPSARSRSRCTRACHSHITASSSDAGHGTTFKTSTDSMRRPEPYPALAAEPRSNRMHWSSSLAALAMRRTMIGRLISPRPSSPRKSAVRTFVALSSLPPHAKDAHARLGSAPLSLVFPGLTHRGRTLSQAGVASASRARSAASRGSGVRRSPSAVPCFARVRGASRSAVTPCCTAPASAMATTRASSRPEVPRLDRVGKKASLTKLAVARGTLRLNASELLDLD